MDSYTWTINDRAYRDREPLQIRDGENVRHRLRNRTMMFHPMHVHGHTFQVRGENRSGARKDTVMVLPMETITVDLVAGQSRSVIGALSQHLPRRVRDDDQLSYVD